MVTAVPIAAVFEPAPLESPILWFQTQQISAPQRSLEVGSMFSSFVSSAALPLCIPLYFLAFVRTVRLT